MAKLKGVSGIDSIITILKYTYTKRVAESLCFTYNEIVLSIIDNRNMFNPKKIHDKQLARTYKKTTRYK